MNRKTKFIIITLVILLLVGIGISTYAYFAAMTSGTSRVNIETVTSSRATISVGNNDSVALTILPEDMLEGAIGINFAESTNEQSGNLHATVSTGNQNGQTCTLTVKYEADEDYLFERSHYCAKDGEANTYTSSCAEGYTMHTSSEITDLPEYSLYLTPTVTVGYLDTGASEIDISDINDDTETTIKTYTWRLPANSSNARVDVNVKARYYNLDFDQNSTADKTYTGNISLSAYCVGETGVIKQTLTKLHLSTADIIKTTPNYVTNPTIETSGLYETPDDYGTSLVFRGKISNNWAKFGKEYVSATCTNAAGTKEILNLYGERITTNADCSATYTYSCSNENTIFVGTTSYINMCKNLNLTVYSGNITGIYHATPVAIEKDIYWRGVRINGDGTLRLIYTGNFIPPIDTINWNGPITRLGLYTLNDNNNNNAYVGYMYGDINGTTYEEVHANINNSNVKKLLDNWYSNSTNLGTTNDEIVSDNYFCYDRSLYKGTINGTDYASGTGIGTVATAYGAAGRLLNSANFTIKTGASPSLICPQANDMFMKNSTTLNNKTTVTTGSKVGLLSADEAVLAGATTSSGSGNYNAIYLYDGWNTLLLGSPSYYPSYSGVFTLTSIMNLSVKFGYDGYRIMVKPVLSVDTSYLTSGNGLATNPWVFEKTNS